MSLLELSQILGNIGEFAGAILLFASLIFVGFQIKQNTASLEENRKYAIAQTYQARTDTYVELMKLRPSDVYGKLGGGPLTDNFDLDKIDELTESEKDKLFSHMGAVMASIDNALLQQSMNLMGSDREAQKKMINSFLPIWNKLDVPIRQAIAIYIDEPGLDESNA